MNDLVYAVELTITGLLIGVMYAMVALGFVLIYKASAVFNFAQGAMTLFAALMVVGLRPVFGLAGALAAALAGMAVIAVAVERFVLRPLVGRSALAIFMATVAVASILEGVAQIVWGNQPRGLKLDLPAAPLQFHGVYVSPADLMGAGVAGLSVLLIALFFRWTRVGLGLRALASDPIAAQAMGVPTHRVWAAAWTLAGAVAIVAGVLWGSRIGVHFGMTQITLKALPILIIGGIESIPGVILAGLLVGAAEALGEGFLGPIVGGGVQEMIAYLAALLVLLLRPHGLLGEKSVERI
ncbi:amino acid/amide ABC transporter membrane protein 1 (HAAT family) [Stella humosa]|uniref:Amino acid/amide ABC transporter membrane protein 1 (HAAT family) n=1 Tax=Stella humosa TaxID=94 RepID=A0A3N1KRD5_9PROT|nr:branched-chain amino acid ABC transporter permease [Stella humosa]ROP81359.1 amino acid/amide ABC transporter membrane protein 1 (HAAT family) [Stella humosa]BBK32709.1 branched-chain amino acid ABC transporter permease [Stella humosa]